MNLAYSLVEKYCYEGKYRLTVFDLHIWFSPIVHYIYLILVDNSVTLEARWTSTYAHMLVSINKENFHIDFFCPFPSNL